MSKYTSIIPTITGQAMLAEAISTQQELIFTSIRLGDGVLTESDVPTEFTALKAQKLVADINTFDDSLKAQGKVTLIATIDNSHVDAGFFARELGVFGKVGTEGAEQLFAYCNAGNYADYMPDKTSQLDETQLAVQLAVGATANVTAIINSLQYATLKNISDAITAHDEDEDAHDGILEKVSELLGDIVTHLASSAAISISELSTDSIFYRLLAFALNAAGVRYNFSNSNAWYICLGALFGGLIIQGGKFGQSIEIEANSSTKVSVTPSITATFLVGFASDYIGSYPMSYSRDNEVSVRNPFANKRTITAYIQWITFCKPA